MVSVDKPFCSQVQVSSEMKPSQIHLSHNGALHKIELSKCLLNSVLYNKNSDDNKTHKNIGYNL